MYGGSLWDLYAYDISQVTMSGGSVSNFLTYSSGQAIMSGGSVNYSLYAYDSSQVTMSGVSLGWNLYVSTSSHLTMSGGSVGGYLSASSNGLVNWSGGTIAQDLRLDSATTLKINGSNFAVDGIPFGFGEIASIFGGSYGNEPHRILTGTLANGDIINNQFRIGETASIVLVPEPATLLLLGLGVPMLSGLRKKHC
jgi:hypothetical protein